MRVFVCMRVSVCVSVCIFVSVRVCVSLPVSVSEARPRAANGAFVLVSSGLGRGAGAVSTVMSRTEHTPEPL